MNAFGLEALMASADEGPVVHGRLTPLSGQGDLCVFLRGCPVGCAPSEDGFEWEIAKAGGKVGLTPKQLISNQKIYTTVWTINDGAAKRHPLMIFDDITRVGMFEQMTLHEQGFLVIALQAWNGQYLTVNPAALVFDGCPALYTVGSDAADSSSKASRFFLGVTKNLQPHLSVPTARETGAAAIAQSLADMDVADAAAMASRIAGD